MLNHGVSATDNDIVQAILKAGYVPLEKVVIDSEKARQIISKTQWENWNKGFARKSQVEMDTEIATALSQSKDILKVGENE